MTDPSESDQTIQAFVERWRRDQSEGVERELVEYLQLFPGHDDAVARAFLRHRHEVAQGRDETTIGPYRTSHELGRGGQGVVYRARHTELGHDVALKVLQGLGPGSGHLLERFHREARVAARLNHPGICQVIDAGIESGVPFMAMQFIEGETLEQRIQRTQGSQSASEATQVLETPDTPSSSGQPSHAGATTTLKRSEIDDLLLLFERTARALHAAHEAGVIHRDIKPANIMIRPDGDPVILDFGLAHSEDDDLQTLTTTGDFFGTPVYMSPEQLEADHGRIDARTDVWSLGVALFESVALRRPFEAPSRDALYQAILNRDAPSLKRIAPTVPNDLAIVVAKALEKDPEQRYASALQLAEELERVRRRQPIVTRPIGPLVRTQRWAQRNPVVAALLTTVILVLSVSTVLTTRSARDARDALAAETEERQAKQLALEAESEALDRMTAARDAEATERGLKEGALAEYERLADTRRLADARARSDELWPVTPDLRPGLLAWQSTFGALLDPERLEGHREALRRLRDEASPYTDHDRATDFPEEHAELDRLTRAEPDLAAAVERAESDARRQSLQDQLDRLRARRGDLQEIMANRRTWRFDAADQSFRHEILSQLVDDLAAFVGSGKSGIGTSISDRLQRAEAIQMRTVTGASVARAWQEVMERVRKNERYRIDDATRKRIGPAERIDRLFDASGSMMLRPQTGLIPLGPDPASGLEEFLHLESHGVDASGEPFGWPERRSGNRPARGSSFLMTPETGIILVLVPAGTFFMGSQNTNPNQPNFDPDHVEHEGPVHEVSLAPYFLSKYEITQGQWSRCATRTAAGPPDPSTYPVGSFQGQPDILPRPVDATHPVEQVDWFMCMRWTERLGLTLPTEAQWERAARANHPDFRWSGRGSIVEISQVANISGQETASAAPGWQRTTEHRDSYLPHAPVGSFAPNGFGIHDMTGNVWEWTRDRFAKYDESVRLGDGLREVDAAVCVDRGGSFDRAAPEARVAMRSAGSPQVRSSTLGLRPSRILTLD